MWWIKKRPNNGGGFRHKSVWGLLGFQQMNPLVNYGEGEGLRRSFQVGKCEAGIGIMIGKMVYVDVIFLQLVLFVFSSSGTEVA
ncbi:hypothetical protein HanPI659440_Chr06g0233151 [Helianthus annuus]|nr:hypothetical protein HanIR_Chr06g0275021 [Helianthus annuus]KAJ0780038.1 hypothetical protein HanPI659440_Chr06g0233151 [Helianthus annuus]